MSNPMIDINKEISKYKWDKDEADSKLKNLKEDYRDELVKECVEGLMQIKNNEGNLSERDLTVFIKNLSYDIRNLYLK